MTSRLAFSLSLSLSLLLATAATLAAQDGEVRLEGLQGGQLTEEALGRGRHIVVFWTTWSPRGRDIVERANALVGEFGSDVVTVNFQEDAADVRSFLAGKRLRAPVYLDTDGALSKKYRVNSAPWLLVLDGGRVAYSDNLPADAATAIRQALQ